MNEWRSSLKSRTSYLLSSHNHLSDCTVYVGEAAIECPAHSLLLSLASPVFEKELANCESKSCVRIRMKDVSLKTFRKLQKYIYTDEVEFDNIIDAQELFCAAENFEMTHLQQVCQKYIEEKHVAAERACKMYEASLDSNLVEILELCMNTFVTLTKQVLDSPQFLDARLNTVEVILKCECLNIDSEMDLIEAVIKWGCSQCLRQKKPPDSLNVREIILPLIRYIRFLSLTWMQFQQFLAKHDILGAQEACAIAVMLVQPGKEIPLPGTICPSTEKRRCPDFFRAYSIPRQDSNMGAYSLTEKKVQEYINTNHCGPCPPNNSPKMVNNNSSELSSCSSLNHSSQLLAPVDFENSKCSLNHEQVAGKTQELPNGGISEGVMQFSEHFIKKYSEKVDRNSSEQVTPGIEVTTQRIALSQEVKGSIETTLNIEETLHTQNVECEVAEQLVENEHGSGSIQDDPVSDVEEEDIDTLNSEEIAELIGKSLKCFIELDSTTSVSDGARVSSVSSDADVEILHGTLKLIGLELSMNKRNMRGSFDVIVRITSENERYECRHDVLESSLILFPKFFSLCRGRKIHIQVMAESLQLYCCYLGSVQRIVVEDVNLKFNVDVYGNQKVVDNKVPYIINEILFVPDSLCGNDQLTSAA